MTPPLPPPLTEEVEEAIKKYRSAVANRVLCPTPKGCRRYHRALEVAARVALNATIQRVLEGARAERQPCPESPCVLPAGHEGPHRCPYVGPCDGAYCKSAVCADDAADPDGALG